MRSLSYKFQLASEVGFFLKSKVHLGGYLAMTKLEEEVGKALPSGPIEEQLRSHGSNWPCLQLFRMTMTW